MPAKTLHYVMIAAMALGFAATAALAQDSSPCGVYGMGANVYGAMSKIPTPFSATVRTTHEQTLADGNVIRGSVTTHQARDSAGRTMSEMSGGCVTGPDGQLRPAVRVSVYDPTNRTSVSWTATDGSPKIVHISHVITEPPHVATPMSAEQRQQAEQRQRLERLRYRSERLGSKMIDGVMAEGTRTVRTIPAGEEGNEQPMEFTDEMWIAKDIGLAMLHITDTPLAGRTTVEVETLDPSEPDPALFTPPAGYTIEEQTTKIVSTPPPGQ